MKTDDAALKEWLDDCDEWIAADDISDADAVKFLRARLKRAVAELRARMEPPVSTGDPMFAGLIDHLVEAQKED